MEPLTVHTASALHALQHRAALTRAERHAVDAHPAPLVPPLRLGAARLPDAATLELALLWCGLAPEPEAMRRVAEALRRDRARLGALAAALGGDACALTGAEARTVRDARCALLTERALRIACTAPLAEADACTGALAVALETAPPASPDLAHVCELLLALYRTHGDDARARHAVERIERLAQAHGVAADAHPHVPAAALVLSILWCITHRTMLLPAERGLDPHVEPTAEGWNHIRTAALRADAHAIPVPVATAAAWSVGEAPDEAALRAGLRVLPVQLPETLAAVECVWGGAAGDGICDDALREVLLVARMRRAGLDAGYRAPEDARAFLWFDVHQGARSADAVERVALVRRLQMMFERHGDAAPGTRTHLHLDRAIEREARGDHACARAELEAALALEASDPSVEPNEEPAARLAVWRWSEGDVRGARRLLSGLTGKTARTVRRTLAGYSRHRKALREARRLARGDPSVEAASRVALAECRAGHLVAAERTARTACGGHGEAPLAWTTLARVRCAAGRLRDAVDPARRALALGAECPKANALLARVLARIGPEGREEGAARAGVALDADARHRVLDADTASELEAIARGRRSRATEPETS